MTEFGLTSGASQDARIAEITSLVKKLDSLPNTQKSSAANASAANEASKSNEQKSAVDVSSDTTEKSVQAKSDVQTYESRQSNLSTAQANVANARGVGEDTKADLKSIQAKVKEGSAEGVTDEQRATLQGEINDLVKGINDRVKSAGVDGVNLSAGSKKDAASVASLGSTENGKVDVSGVAFDAKALGVGEITLGEDNSEVLKTLDSAVEAADKGLATLGKAADTINANSQALEDENLSNNSQSAVAAFLNFQAEKNQEFFGASDRGVGATGGINAALNNSSAISASQGIADQLRQSSYSIANGNPSLLSLFS